MSPLQIWCNEAQERYVLAVAPANLAEFAAICARERCPLAVVGEASGDARLTVVDPEFGNTPVDMELSTLLGKPPRMTRDVAHERRELPPFDLGEIDLCDAVYRVLRLPWARRIYDHRKTQGERPFAEIKQTMRFRRFSLRVARTSEANGTSCVRRRTP